ncbi:DNA ligase [Vibrio panuliri]|uniref:DNA ligase n=1 Tax=Vibrio panuliri TaxID=1381081 RepID=A0A1Q9HF41_9VIBR|nr:DNA ligase [Vibrio panuliri]OLQ88354.1 DNA ligase [Vibrio panuliri]
MQLKLTTIAISLMFAGQSSADTTAMTQALPQVVLADIYQQGVDITDYWQSEKLDGIRAIWDGRQLLTRKGRTIYAPDWFVAALPTFPVEGELWAGRGNFSLVQQTVLDHQPTDSAWRSIDFMLFDLPHSAGDYVKRYANLVYLVEQLKQPHIKYVEHQPIPSEHDLIDYLDHVDEKRGEGIMLRKTSSRYQAGRSSDLLKLKRYLDDEATVIGYKVGGGKYKGMLGSLLVRWKDGKEFYIGTGFTDQQRMQPPPIGSLITFRYNGLTSGDLPRFARFVRLKVE